MNAVPESWFVIEENPDYAVSSHGRIKRLARGHGTRPGHIVLGRKGRGCRYINIRINGTKKSLKIHRLVALAFLGPPPTPSHQVAHCNGDPYDNRLENLRWATATENNRDKAVHGTQCKGSTHGKSKLKETDVPAIRALAKSGIGPTAIAKTYGVRKGTIQFLLEGRTWSHVA